MRNVSQRVSDVYPDTEDFQRLLSDASSQARSEWDQQFVSDLNQRFEQYGAGMFVSARQIEVLERIVG